MCYFQPILVCSVVCLQSCFCRSECIVLCGCVLGLRLGSVKGNRLTKLMRESKPVNGLEPVADNRMVDQILLTFSPKKKMGGFKWSFVRHKTKQQKTCLDTENSNKK